MLTVKHIDVMGGESVFPAKDVRYTPNKFTMTGVTADGRRTGKVCPDGQIHIDMEDGSIRHLIGGTIYVMNDKGATVAKYDMGGWAAPQASVEVKIDDPSNWRNTAHTADKLPSDPGDVPVA